MGVAATDHTGAIFGRLTALKFLYRKGTAKHWLFRCSCGKEKAISIKTVASGAVRSCGCLHTERCRSGLNRTRHGQARAGKVTRLHNIWRGILKRVDARIGEAREKYAARGIMVCQEWREFEPFREWATANGYADHLTIDRIDNNGHYEPSNCRWTTPKEQCRNRRSSRKLVAFGSARTIAEWAEISGIKGPTISARISLGWSPEDAVTKALHTRN